MIKQGGDMWKQFKVLDIRTRTEGKVVFKDDDYFILFDDGEVLYREDTLLPLSKLFKISISGIEPVLEGAEKIDDIMFLKSEKWI